MKELVQHLKDTGILKTPALLANLLGKKGRVHATELVPELVNTGFEGFVFVPLR